MTGTLRLLCRNPHLVSKPTRRLIFEVRKEGELSCFVLSCLVFSQLFLAASHVSHAPQPGGHSDITYTTARWPLAAELVVESEGGTCTNTNRLGYQSVGGCQTCPMINQPVGGAGVSV